MLSFKFTPNYPEELCEIIIDELENVEDEDELLEFLKQIVEKLTNLILKQFNNL